MAGQNISRNDKENYREETFTRSIHFDASIAGDFLYWNVHNGETTKLT